MDREQIKKLARDSAEKEIKINPRTNYYDHYRGFMEGVRMFSLINDAPDCPNCGNHYPHHLKDGSHSCDECGNKW